MFQNLISLYHKKKNPKKKKKIIERTLYNIYAIFTLHKVAEIFVVTPQM